MVQGLPFWVQGFWCRNLLIEFNGTGCGEYGPAGVESCGLRASSSPYSLLVSLELSDTKSTSLEYELSSEPLHIYARKLF